MMIQTKKETPIIFSTEMVKAILEGRKTQTRRILKPQPDMGLPEFERYSEITVGPYHPTKVDKDGYEYPGEMIFGAYTNDGEWGWKCPYGDLLWVRETFCMPELQDAYEPDDIWYKASTDDDCMEYISWKPSIHMPKWACRIWLEITDIKVEKLQEIGKLTHDDCLKEGYPYGYDIHSLNEHPIKTFSRLWNSINEKRGYGWDKNPWVWVISFKRDSY